jgi:hypothetical protein
MAIALAVCVACGPEAKYRGPVKGHLKEANAGDFDLVDGVASPSAAEPGKTVVFVVEKPIASEALAASPCPMAMARSMMSLRNAGWVEVSLDGAGRSAYFAEGSPFGGEGREEDTGKPAWKGELQVRDGHAVGSVSHRYDGSFRFDLPLSRPRYPEVTESEWFQKKRGVAGVPAPELDALTIAYDALHRAAAAKDLGAFLARQGFDEHQVAAIRGLDGIAADFAVYADRFLTPGEGGEPRRGPGWASIRSEGTSSKGEKFANYYWFTTCGEKLLLTRISVNPR